jgi:serine-type D-Ala-D-Ala carboxypeptidase/endopeptidase (penicillin-binding protein 4)
MRPLPHILLVLCFLPTAALFSTPPLKNATEPSVQQEKLLSRIQGILPRNAKGLSVGVFAATIYPRESIVSLNADQLLIPASVSKVFTSYTALKKLGPASTFKTTVLADGPISDGKLSGNLFLKGGGDPSLVSERMWMMVNELIRTGIKHITGNIIADASFYDLERTPDTRPKYLKDQAYNAPVGALSFNFNTTTVYVRPAEQVGKPPTIVIDPENSYVDVVNQATTSSASAEPSITASRTEYVKGDLGDTVLLRGSVPLGNKEVRFYRNIVNPSLYTAHMFQTFWQRRGLKLDGVIKEGVTPASAKQILQFESLPMWQVVWGMNKFSNNFVADQILKKVGAESWGAPGNLTKGLTTMQDVLEDIGIPRKTYEIKDGSGLTRDTHVTARQVVHVLLSAHDDMTVAPEFMSSFGIAGEDGTLRSRFQASRLRTQLRAKTGSLDGVTALAGFCPTKDAEPMAFAILLNDTKLKYGKMTGWADQIAMEVCDFSRKK